MITEWELTGLYLRKKYDDNYTFIKNPKLKVFDSNLVQLISVQRRLLTQLAK